MDKKNGLILFGFIFLIQSLAFASLYAIEVEINHQLFNLQVAKTPKELAQGMMYIKHVEKGTGMIFYFPPNYSQEVIMWMKNTYIPLDMLFIGPDQKINCIIKNTKPHSLEPITCKGKTKVVIEMNAGEADTYHFTQGMQVNGL